MSLVFLHKETEEAKAIYKELLEIEAGAWFIRNKRSLNRVDVTYKKKYGKKVISQVWDLLHNKNIKAFLGMGHNKVIAHFENSRITIHAKK